MTDWWPLALVVLLLLVVIAGWLLWRATTTAKERGARSGTAYSSSSGRGAQGGTQAETTADETSTAALPRAAVVVNPTKFDRTDKVRAEISKVCRGHGWADPLWLETTLEDPGYGQTKAALAEGVDLVCALGGDGTVRIVGSAMVGSEVPMGLLSAGTGNLLARNLSLPVTSLTQGMKVALTGADHRIDTATLRLRRPLRDADDEDAPPPVDTSDLDDLPPVPRQGEGEVEDHIFLVMAGIGFDAEVMANAPEKLKKQVGWAAYIVSGAQRLKGKQFKVDVRTDAGVRLRRRVRSVIIGNVGKLTGGLNLVPQAQADDGILDLVLLSPEGLVGWGAVVTRLVTRSSRGHQRVDYYTGRTIEVTSDEPVEIQLDGDTLGLATAMTIGVNPGSLILRRPA
ncbi:diacylglycerol/lipid kinase family protein [Ornithinimicrobium cryptoxanthini]|uniref:Diacylglycerol kinase family lipid kinase n=1 Tax=Ornithinimicrobium cryptoxanthini TaxID=2934161 RepID=A0ABY4YI56_9MICO|nr:diacylglycerol kinase family protein [Ornithinimicrobium cryptoxanthini]USQ76480.1 diacylglycerol kinase family lipid kinase [Ornithinimicrobium cryptoxanthini]